MSEALLSTAEQGADEVLVRRVGPGHPMAADSAFGVALVSLWHKVSLAGGPVGFVSPVQRAEIAPVAARAVEDLRANRAQAIALVAGRSIVGFGQLVPGTGLQAHTGHLATLMVDPDLQGTGRGGRLLDVLLDLAVELGLERVDLAVRSGHDLEALCAKWGFTEYGRRPGWIRIAGGEDRDEVLMALTLAERLR